MQDRKTYWAESFKETVIQKLLFVDRPYCKGLRLSDNQFQAINEQVFSILYHSFDQDNQQQLASPQNHLGIIDKLSETEIFFVNVTEQLDRFTELEYRVLSAFDQAGLLKNFVGIQFPMDIRIVHPAPPPNYLKRRDAVDFMHCDPWRGEPPDEINCLIYNWVSNETSQLLAYDVPVDMIDTVANFQGTERDTDVLVKDLKTVEFIHEPGQAILFDAYLPHNTKRNGSKIRISLNFSFRRADPYEKFDERWDRDRQPWSKYWYMPHPVTHTFADRCSQEMAQLSQKGMTEALQRRKEAIEKLKHAKRPEELYAG